MEGMELYIKKIIIVHGWYNSHAHNNSWKIQSYILENTNLFVTIYDTPSFAVYKFIATDGNDYIHKFVINGHNDVNITTYKSLS